MIGKSSLGLAALAALSLGAAQPALARAEAASAERVAPDKVLVTWTARAPVDVYLAFRPDAAPDAAKAISLEDRDGRAEVAVTGSERPYFLLRDVSDGSVVDVAERLVPLERGSNFRDVGGYATASGKHVRWGLIYRSGATPMLDASDLAEVKALGLHDMVDLRSDEERVLAPTKIDGVAYSAVGYSMAEIFKGMKGQGNGGQLYRNFPTMLAPQMRILFAILERDQGPVVYNCSAGQDRTGFATALILSALGVPRETIEKDYHLSTAYRRPQYEMPHIDAAQFPNNPVAQFFARYQGDDAKPRSPEPLYDPDGTSFLASAFDEIDKKWGSVDAYLEQEIGVTPADLQTLRADYLE